MKDDSIREQLVFYAQRAYHRGLVGGTGGNFSARISKGRMAITPSGVSLADTTLENLITVDINTYQWDPVGPFVASKEYRFHADILRLRPDINSVLHIHSPYATAYAVKGKNIPMVTDAAFKQAKVPFVGFAPSGTHELQQNMAEAIESNPECRVILMEKHGMAALGKDVVSAYDMADLHEEIARIAFLSETLP